MLFRALVKALPCWLALGGGGTALVCVGGAGTAPGWGGGGTASCVVCEVRVGVGCENGVGPGTGGAAGCAAGKAGGGPPAAAVVTPASALVVVVGSF